jgi:hypothetical protein
MLFNHFQDVMLYSGQILKASNKTRKSVISNRSSFEFTHSILIDCRIIFHKYISHFNLSFIMEIFSYVHTLKRRNYLISSSIMSIGWENACLINIVLKNPKKLNYLHQKWIIPDFWSLKSKNQYSCFQYGRYVKELNQKLFQLSSDFSWISSVVHLPRTINSAIKTFYKSAFKEGFRAFPHCERSHVSNNIRKIWVIIVGYWIRYIEMFQLHTISYQQ